MIANALAYVGPIKQILDLLSQEEFVPAEAQNVMAPVSDGLEVAQQLGPPLERLLSESWDSLAGRWVRSRSPRSAGRWVRCRSPRSRSLG